MKPLLLWFLLFAEILFTNSIHAQEAKLVKQGEWGSGIYNHLVEINGYYYIQTSSNQIDVVNPKLTGKDSLVGQIDLDLEFFPDIHSIGKFKDYLVVVSYNKLSIYSVSDITKLTKIYSISTSGGGSQPVSSQNNYLYYVDSDSKIFVIKEVGDSFQLTEVIQSKKDNHNEDISIWSRYLFVDDSSIYYWYTQQNQGATTTHLELYETSGFTLFDSGYWEDFNLSWEPTYIGDGRFVISNYKNLYLTKLTEGKINILSDFNNVKYLAAENLAYKNNMLRVISNNQLYSFHVSESNITTLLSNENLNSYFLNNVHINYFDWVDDKLIGLSHENGIFKIKIKNDTVEDVEFLYNQSGYIGKAVIKDDFIYLPRKERVDLVNISDLDDISLHHSISISTENILAINDNFIFNDFRTIGHYTLINNTDFQLNSEDSNAFIQSDILLIESDLFHIADDEEYEIRKYSINTPFSLYEPAIKARFTNTVELCPQDLLFVNSKLIAVDSCGGFQLHLFSNHDNDNFSYNKRFEFDRGYNHVEAKNEYMYFISSEGIDVFKLTDAEELEKIIYIDIGFNRTAGIYEAKVLGDYLLVSDSNYFYLIDVSIADLPKLISKTRISNWEWNDANFQLITGYVVVTTKYNGKVKLFQINKAPVANIYTFTVNEDEVSEPLSIFTDLESDPVTYTIITQASLGHLTIDETEFVFTPHENVNGEDIVTIRAEDTYGNFIEHEVSITISPVNDAPNIITQSLTTDEDQTLITNIEGNDIEQNSFVFSISTSPNKGSATIDDSGELIFIPEKDYNGDDTILITITDEYGASNTTEVSVTVNPINDAPVTSNQAFIVDEDAVLTEQLMASDIDDDSLIFSLVEASSSGSISIKSTGEFTYKPNANFFGNDTFKFSATDSQGLSSSAKVSIGVTSKNDAPSFGNTVFSLQEDNALVGTIEFNDVDSTNLKIELLIPPVNGVIDLNELGEFTYTPFDNFSGVDKFTVEIMDDKNLSTVAEITLNIAPVNDAPVIHNTRYIVDEDNQLSGVLEASDMEGNDVIFTLIDDSELMGSVTLTHNGNFIFTPNINFYGDTSFTVRANDNASGNADYLITISVKPIDDIPVLTDINKTVSFGTSISDALPSEDIDGDALIYSIVENVKNGTLTFSSEGRYTYQPNANFSGTDSFVYSATDTNGNNAESKVAFTVQVKPKESKSNSGGGNFSYFLILCLTSMIAYRRFRILNMF